MSGSVKARVVNPELKHDFVLEVVENNDSQRHHNPYSLMDYLLAFQVTKKKWQRGFYNGEDEGESEDVSRICVYITGKDRFVIEGRELVRVVDSMAKAKL